MKIKSIFSNLIIWPSLFLIVLAGSLIIYFGQANLRVERTLFFPIELTGKLNGEMRRLPLRKGKEENIELFIEELILGPRKIENARLLPEETDIRYLLLRGDKLFIDFDSDILFREEQVSLSLKEIIDILKKTLKFNFNFIKEIHITIMGQLPRFGENLGK
ncbi:MAG: hypothetical protein DRP87_04785 [Spirochaetes bacterium]|nr:MAG: hypothetical protein DRP87_04785 [Spirochaetota bacterium]